MSTFEKYIAEAAEEDFNQTWPAEAKTQVAEAPRKHWRKQVMSISITDRRPVFDTAQMSFNESSIHEIIKKSMYTNELHQELRLGIK